jgi:phage replication-related protein YjqB (UPF0714/DUF867 family)
LGAPETDWKCEAGTVADKYANFAALARSEASPEAWRIHQAGRRDSDVLIIAPHGGRIEHGTSELAAMIAGEDYSLYCFEGLKPHGNRDLHITSHAFDEPVALSLAAQCAIVVGVHGCAGDNSIYVGGLDMPLVALMTAALAKRGLPASSESHGYPAINPHNICNRSRRNRGAQLEVSYDLRLDAPHEIAAAVRVAIGAHFEGLVDQLPAEQAPGAAAL